MKDLTKQFDKKKELYNSFMNEVRKLIYELLKDESITINSIESRVKTINSLEKKVAKNKNRFSSIEDIPDICGIRSITFFEEDLDRVAEIINDEFNIDEENSVDKRFMLDADKFGYMSSHYVIILPPNHSLCSRNKNFYGLKIEVQIRSILQHAWAEIEHDLGYKSTTVIPRSIRRKFSRLAGLLEMADLEFNRIKNNIYEYEKGLPSRINEDPDSVYINKSSLMQFLRSSSRLEKIEVNLLSQLKEKSQNKIRQFYEDRIPTFVEILLYHRIMVISALDRAIKSNSKAINYFGLKFLSNHDESYWGLKPPVGLSIYLLGLILTSSTLDIQKVINYLEHFKIGPVANRNDFAKELVDWYNEFKNKSAI